jgi:hypothetical protein
VNVESSHVAGRAAIGTVVAFAIALSMASGAGAEPEDVVDPGLPAPVVAPVTADNADPAAVLACSQFAEVLTATATYYGDFAEALETYEHPDYNDPATSASNVTARTALRQGAGVTMSAANTPGLAPQIADPMRSWSWGATKLLVKMGVRGGRETLNTTADDMNTDASNVQAACATAGTHA